MLTSWFTIEVDREDIFMIVIGVISHAQVQVMTCRVAQRKQYRGVHMCHEQGCLRSWELTNCLVL